MSLLALTCVLVPTFALQDDVCLDETVTTGLSAYAPFPNVSSCTHNVDCVSASSACTAACEAAADRTVVVTTQPNFDGQTHICARVALFVAVRVLAHQDMVGRRTFYTHNAKTFVGIVLQFEMSKVVDSRVSMVQMLVQPWCPFGPPFGLAFLLRSCCAPRCTGHRGWSWNRCGHLTNL